MPISLTIRTTPTEDAMLERRRAGINGGTKFATVAAMLEAKVDNVVDGWAGDEALERQAIIDAIDQAPASVRATVKKALGISS